MAQWFGVWTCALPISAQKGLWRNGLVFGPNDPTKGTGKFSYAQVILDPLIRALNAVRKPDTKIWLGMQASLSSLCL